MTQTPRDRALSRPPTAARRPGTPHSATPVAPPRPMLGDPFAWLSALAVLIVVARAWGAPLGEPVAEDFDFLQRALFGPFNLLDGGGSTAFWRPIPHQLYYLTLGRIMIAAPGVVAAIHAVLLGAASLLLYRAFRTGRSGLWAAVVATAPLFAESTRTLVTWPSHFVDLGLWLFVALAAHETAARRLPTALAALFAALLCKEVAVIAALLLPLMPGIGPRDDRTRLRWSAAFAITAAAWAALYLAVRSHAHLQMPHHMETSMLTASWFERLGWALANSLRAIVSLPLMESTRDRYVGTLLTLMLLVWAAVALRDARSRARWRGAVPWAMWGFAWFLGASATLTTVFPYWMPNRSAFGSLGLVALAAELASIAHPLFLAGLVAVRLFAFSVAPGPPPRITNVPAATGAFMDFEQLTRLQRLMRDSRTALAGHTPVATPGMRVGAHFMPRRAQYAFGGHHALRAWYRDPGLDWVPFARVRAHPDSALAAIVEFEPDGTPQAAIVEPGAMRAYLAALDHIRASEWAAAESLLVIGERAQKDENARVFRAMVLGDRARAMLGEGRIEDAEHEAQKARTLFERDISAHYVLGATAFLRGDILEAAGHVDSVLKWSPGDAAALKLREGVIEAARRRAR